MTANEKMIALMRRLRTEMNGAVTDSMRERGTSYGLNYGVSLPTIKAIAESYAPDHELAALLWKQDVRELRLAALFIADPRQLTASQMERWSGEWTTAELAEQSAMQLFWQSPDALAAARRWLASESELPFRRLAAFYMIGRRSATVSQKELAGWLSADPSESGLNPDTAERSAVYALREIYRQHPDLRPLVLQALNRLPDSLADELRWQIEYLD